MAFLGQEEQIREFQDRFKYLYTVLFLGLSIIVSRLVYLQVLKGDFYRASSEENRIKRIKVKAPRGMVFDRNNQLLIDNRPDFDLEIIPQYLKESHLENEVISTLAKIIKMSPEEIRKKIADKGKNLQKFIPIKIKIDLTRDEVARIEVQKIDMPGVEIKEEIKRTNAYRDVAAHLLGYVSEISPSELPILNRKGIHKYHISDEIGRFGLEQRMEEFLRGTDGEEVREVDVTGRVKLDRHSLLFDYHPPKVVVPGHNLTLTIDQELQHTAITAFGDRIGAVVALSPKTGEILSMISRPSFDPTAFSRGISSQYWNSLVNNENHPLRDKTIQDHYPPGSTFKVVTAVAGLEEGVIDENSTFHCPGKIKIGNRLYHCHHRHGDVNLVRALTQSCDVFFYRVAQKLKSVDDIAKWAFILGLGKKTKINLSGEVAGLIPTEEWKMKRFNLPWNAGETATVAIGQSYVATTILQLANLYAAVSNGGTLYQPFIVKKITNAEGELIKEFQPEILSQVNLSKKTVELIQQGLWGVMNTPGGTGYSQRLPGIDFAGKTGTSQVVKIAAEKIYEKCEKMKLADRHNAMFVGFAPSQDPEIVVAVVGEHACHGASGAAPVARAIIKRYLEKYFPNTFDAKALAKGSKWGVDAKKLGEPAAALMEDESFANPPSSVLVVPSSEPGLAPAGLPVAPIILPLNTSTAPSSSEEDDKQELDSHE